MGHTWPCGGDIPGASGSRHRKIQAGNRLRSVAQRVTASQEARHLGSHRAACGLSASSRGATQPPTRSRGHCLRSCAKRHAINLGGGDLVKLRNPIARLDLPRSRSIATAARFASLSGNGSLAQLPTRAIHRCLAPPGRATSINQPGTIIFRDYPAGRCRS